MTTSTNHLRLAGRFEPDVVPITAYQLDILVALDKRGPQRAYVFDEREVNELFKMRPRLIRLVPGHEDPVITLTPDGRQRLAAEREAAS